MADTIAIIMMALALVILLIAFVRLFPDLVAEARTDARTIREIRAKTGPRNREAR